MNDQESCVINAGHTTKYFKLQKGARQGDPLSAYLFIICMDVVFSMIENNTNVKGLTLLGHTFLYTAYADDSTFFIENLDSARHILETFKHFSRFSGLCPNYSKCELSGIGSKKGVHVALCGMKCIDLTKETIKVLGIHFSYNKFLETEKNFFSTIKSITSVLRMWKMRNMSLEGKITIFKSLAI